MTCVTTRQLHVAPAADRERLLAGRLAGAAFEGPFRLRSPGFEALLEEWTALGEALARERDPLLDALYEAVPKASGSKERRRLLEIRRGVFNGRPLADPPPGIAPELARALVRYADLDQRRATLFEERRDAIFREIRGKLRDLVRDERFELACRYASPDLFADLEKSGLAAGGELTTLERGLYTYAARFFSKANPFHLFAEVVFPEATGIEADGAHEIVVDAAVILELERRLLPQVRDPRRIRLELRTYERRDKTLRFWVPTPEGFRIVTLAADELLLLVTSFFENHRRWHGRPTPTRAEWREYVLARAAPARLSEAEAHLEGLLRLGVVAPYLVSDLGDAASAFVDPDPALASAVAGLRRHHLARTPSAALRRLDGELTEALRHLSPEPRPLYFVNSYSRIDTAAFEEAAGELADELRDLKPFFSVWHNYERHDDVIRAYLGDYLEHRGQDSVAYLEVLRHYLRHTGEILARYVPESRRTVEERRHLAASYGRLRAREGRIGREELARLAAAAGVPPTSRSLCFNGPFDFVDRFYYITNVFAGNGRFASRYLLHRRAETAVGAAPEEGVIDVEIVVPPPPNLNYVVPSFATGCGFEARHAHRYERWIDPSEILIDRADGGVAYRHAGSRARLRLHYRGFQVAQLLPTEYQLLLVGHADSFSNPFLRPEAAPGEDGLSHENALWYGSVCLRRESWGLGRAFFDGLRQERDLLRFAVLLRERIRERLSSAADEWYYQVPESGRPTGKPRLLDLRHPLSVHAFRRSLNALPEEGTLSLTAMEPSPAHLFRKDGSGFVTELMIEV